LLALDYKSLGSKRSLSFDTETILGYAKLLTLGNGSHHFIDSFESAMAILESTAEIYFGWNADYDIIALLKYLPEDNLKELHLKHRTSYGPYEIRYIPEKFMHVKNRSTCRTISFYDLSQFYGRISLDKASELYLGEHKVKNDLEKEFKALCNDLQSSGDNHLCVVHGKDFLSDIRSSLLKRLDTILHSSEFIEYAVKDAILTQSLLDLFTNTLKGLGLSDLTSFNSHASLVEQLYLRYAEHNSIELPDISDLSERLIRDVKRFYKGGMFMCLKRGSFGAVTNLDVSSAYPYQLSKLPNLKDGHFELVKDGSLIDTELSKGLEDSDGLYRLLGWVDVYTDNPFIGAKAKDGSVVYRIGYRHEKITLFEYAVLKKHGIPVDFIKAWIWISNGSSSKGPFRDFVHALYTERKKYPKGTADNLMLKLMLNSLYGKTAQGIMNGIEGWLTNPFYASSVTGGLRAQIIDRVYSDNLVDKVIMISTDGLLVTNEDHYYTESRSAEGLGGWDIDLYDGALVHMCGIYELYKNGKAVKTKTRGFKSKDEDDNPITLRSIFELNKDKEKAKVTETHRVTLGDVFHSHGDTVSISKKYPLSTLNYIITRTKDLSIEDKRMKWNGISTFGDLLNGSYNAVFYDVNTRPIDLSLIELDRAIQTIRTTKQHMVILSDGIELQTSFRALLEAYMESHGLGALEFISLCSLRRLETKTGSITPEKSKEELFNHLCEGSDSISEMDNKWFWEDFGKYVTLQTALHPSERPESYKTYVRGFRELSAEDHPSVFIPMLDGGKFSPYHRSAKKRQQARATAEVLYRLNGSSVFPNRDGYDCYVVLTFPHSDRALSLTEKEAKAIGYEFLERLTKRICELKGIPKDAQYGACVNFHPVKSRDIFSKHPHLDVHMLNTLFVKSSGKFIRFNPKLINDCDSDSELKLKKMGLESKNLTIKDVRNLWKEILRAHNLLDSDTKEVNLKWSYISLSKRSRITQALYYSARSFTWDLLNYISLHDTDPLTLSRDQIAMVNYLTSYQNKRQPLGFWSKLSEYANEIENTELTEECSICGKELTEVKRYNADEGLALFTRNLYFLVDCGYNRYKFYVRTIDGGGG